MFALGLACAVSFSRPWVSVVPSPRDGAADTSPEEASAPEAGSGSEPADAGLALVPDLPTIGLALDSGARSVRVGVVLVQFAGAQGAGPTARPRAAALEQALRLAQEAKADFHQAVTHGDPGSADDIGRIGRGILEPAVEVVVFNIPSGTTSEPIETPRGYWIVKRLE